MLDVHAEVGMILALVWEWAVQWQLHPGWMAAVDWRMASYF